MAKPLIRAARPGDARGIAEVHVASWKAAYAGVVSVEKMSQLDVDERERVWHERLDDADALGLRAWAAVQNDRIVGFALTQPSEDEDLANDVHELKALYVGPSAWRTGIGTSLLSAAESGLRDAGIKLATLWVLESTEGSRFYEARDWTLDKRDPSFKDFGAAALRYQKQL